MLGRDFRAVKLALFRAVRLSLTAPEPPAQQHCDDCITIQFAELAFSSQLSKPGGRWCHAHECSCRTATAGNILPYGQVGHCYCSVPDVLGWMVNHNHGHKRACHFPARCSTLTDAANTPNNSPNDCCCVGALSWAGGQRPNSAIAGGEVARLGRHLSAQPVVSRGDIHRHIRCSWPRGKSPCKTNTHTHKARGRSVVQVGPAAGAAGAAQLACICLFGIIVI
jgi:hypothetical protein